MGKHIYEQATIFRIDITVIGLSWFNFCAETQILFLIVVEKHIFIFLVQVVFFN